MKLTFRSLAILSALVFFSLALTWMFAPNVMLSRWGVDFSYSVGLMARRGASSVCGNRCHALFGKKRWAFARPLSVGYWFCCCLFDTRYAWVFELATGHAGFGISVAVLIEIALTLASLYVARASKASH